MPTTRLLISATLAAILLACAGAKDERLMVQSATGSDSVPGTVEKKVPPAAPTEATAAKTDVMSDLRVLYKELGPAIAEFERLTFEQDVDVADAFLERALAGKPEPAASLLLGNMLFSRNPERAFALHERAAKAAPTDSTVALEWAMELHRAGRFTDAVPMYELVVKELPEGSPHFALLAHCLLAAGRHDDAVAAWNKTNHKHNHISVEKLFDAIYFTPDPWLKRAELRRVARTGDVHAWVQLIRHDLSFARDLWNGGPNDRALVVDHEQARKALADNPKLLADLDVLVRYRTEQIDAEAVRTHVLTHYGRTLPEEFAIARDFVEVLIGDAKQTPAKVLARYGAALRKGADAGDRDAMDILAFLYSETKDMKRLAAIDAVGCERGYATFCSSLVMGKLSSNGEGPDLEAALARFPNEPWFATLKLLRAVERGAYDPETIIRYLTLKPRRMSSSYGFKFAFIALEGVRASKVPSSEFTGTLHSQLEIDLMDRPRP